MYILYQHVVNETTQEECTLWDDMDPNQLMGLLVSDSAQVADEQGASRPSACPPSTTDSTRQVSTHIPRATLHLRFCHWPARVPSLPNQRTIELSRFVHVVAGVVSAYDWSDTSSASSLSLSVMSLTTPTVRRVEDS